MQSDENNRPTLVNHARHSVTKLSQLMATLGSRRTKNTDKSQTSVGKVARNGLDDLGLSSHTMRRLGSKFATTPINTTPVMKRTPRCRLRRESAQEQKEPKVGCSLLQRVAKMVKDHSRHNQMRKVTQGELDPSSGTWRTPLQVTPRLAASRKTRTPTSTALRSAQLKVQSIQDRVRASQRRRSAKTPVSSKRSGSALSPPSTAGSAEWSFQDVPLGLTPSKRAPPPTSTGHFTTPPSTKGTAIAGSARAVVTTPIASALRDMLFQSSPSKADSPAPMEPPRTAGMEDNPYFRELSVRRRTPKPSAVLGRSDKTSGMTADKINVTAAVRQTSRDIVQLLTDSPSNPDSQTWAQQEVSAYMERKRREGALKAYTTTPAESAAVSSDSDVADDVSSDDEDRLMRSLAPTPPASVRSARAVKHVPTPTFADMAGLSGSSTTPSTLQPTAAGNAASNGVYQSDLMAVSDVVVVSEVADNNTGIASSHSTPSDPTSTTPVLPEEAAGLEDDEDPADGVQGMTPMVPAGRTAERDAAEMWGGDDMLGNTPDHGPVPSDHSDADGEGCGSVEPTIKQEPASPTDQSSPTQEDEEGPMGSVIALEVVESSSQAMRRRFAAVDEWEEGAGEAADASVNSPQDQADGPNEKDQTASPDEAPFSSPVQPRMPDHLQQPPSSAKAISVLFVSPARRSARILRRRVGKPPQRGLTSVVGAKQRAGSLSSRARSRTIRSQLPARSGAEKSRSMTPGTPSRFRKILESANFNFLPNKHLSEQALRGLHAEVSPDQAVLMPVLEAEDVRSVTEEQSENAESVGATEQTDATPVEMRGGDVSPSNVSEESDIDEDLLPRPEAMPDINEDMSSGAVDDPYKSGGSASPEATIAATFIGTPRPMHGAVAGGTRTRGKPSSASRVRQSLRLRSKQGRNASRSGALNSQKTGKTASGKRVRAIQRGIFNSPRPSGPPGSVDTFGEPSRVRRSVRVRARTPLRNAPRTLKSVIADDSGEERTRPRKTTQRNGPFEMPGTPLSRKPGFRKGRKGVRARSTAGSSSRRRNTPRPVQSKRLFTPSPPAEDGPGSVNCQAAEGGGTGEDQTTLSQCLEGAVQQVAVSTTLKTIAHTEGDAHTESKESEQQSIGSGDGVESPESDDDNRSPSPVPVHTPLTRSMRRANPAHTLISLEDGVPTCQLGPRAGNDAGVVLSKHSPAHSEFSTPPKEVYTPPITWSASKHGHTLVSAEHSPLSGEENDGDVEGVRAGVVMTGPPRHPLTPA